MTNPDDLIRREDAIALTLLGDAKTVADAIAALPAVSASQPADPVRVTVKPLVWGKGIVDYAKPFPGVKYVSCSTTPKGSWSVWLEDTQWREVHPSEEAAKAAAQADYEARILAAIDVQPDPRDAQIAALVEAAEVLERENHILRQNAIAQGIMEEIGARGQSHRKAIRNLSMIIHNQRVELRTLRAAIAAAKGGDA